MDWALYIWLGLMVVFLITEAVCAIHLVSIWFAAGALVAMIAAALGAKLWLQVTLFIIVSCSLLALLWPFVKKFLNPKLAKTNLDSLIGTECHVTEDIDNIDAHGQIKLGAMYWTARSTSGEPIKAGTLVRVDRIEGVKAFVSVVESKAKKEPTIESNAQV
jgi:membrane protein implicated in regulation of membrane protease activity